MRIIEELPLVFYGNDINEPELIHKSGNKYSQEGAQYLILLKIQEIIKVINHAAELERATQNPIPCPWCSKSPILEEDDQGDWQVICRTGMGFCSVMPCTVHFSTKQEAIAAWNSRK